MFSTPDGISAVDLRTHRITSVVQGKVRLLFVGRRTSLVYYSRPDRNASTTPIGSGTIYAANVDTGKSKEVARVDRGSIGSINADETLLAGTSAQRDVALASGEKPRVGPDGKPLTYADSKEMGLDKRLEAHIPMELFTVSLLRGGPTNETQLGAPRGAHCERNVSGIPRHDSGSNTRSRSGASSARSSQVSMVVTSEAKMRCRKSEGTGPKRCSSKRTRALAAPSARPC